MNCFIHYSFYSTSRRRQVLRPHGLEPRRFCAYRVRQTGAFCAVVQRDAGIHRSRKWRLDLNLLTFRARRVTETRRAAESNSVSCLNRVEWTESECKAWCERDTARRKRMRRAVLL